VRVVKDRVGGVVRRVVLLDDAGVEVVPVNRFLSHLTDANYSPNTVCAYAYDLAHLTRFSIRKRSVGTSSGRRWRWSCWRTYGGCRRSGRRSGWA